MKISIVSVFLSLLNSCLMKEGCSHVMQESKTAFEAVLVENIILLKPVLKQTMFGTWKMTANRFRSFGLSYQMM